MKTIELKPIKESTGDFEAIEKELKAIFRREVYLPLLREIEVSPKALNNAKFNLLDAIRSGRISYYIKAFLGKFSASISKELKELGAKWDRTHGSWMIPLSSLPIDVRSAIASSDAKVKEKLEAIDKKLAKILPEEVAEKVSIEKIFDRLLLKTDNAFKSSLDGIIVAPQITPRIRAKIASEWQDNMKLWVKNFTEKEISKLRGEIQQNAFSGNRHGSIIGLIQKSYDVSANKAKFLARQETSLLLSKFKESRYADSGIHEYIWGCVAGTGRHPVRPWHRTLEGKTFRWDNPPITSEPGEPVKRNNPGEDYNCRCFARPVVKFGAKP